MHYEKVKKKIEKIYGSSIFLRKLFYRLLNILLLRTWHVYRELNKLKDNITKKPVEVLDAGSGFGIYSYFLAKKNPLWNITSVDINKDEIEQCQIFFNKAGINNVSCKVKDITVFYEKNKFDLVLSVDVIEHIENDEDVFKNFYASLKKNGFLIISTPSNKGGSGITEKNKSSFIEEHVREGYSIDEITRKLKNAGFDKVDIKYTYGKFGNLSWYLSIKYPLLMSKFKAMVPVIFLYYILVMPFCILLNFIDLKTKNKTGTGLLVKAYK